MKSAIFSGQVSHARVKPVAHRFNYRVFMMYLDLDELDSVFERRWFWSTKRAALARFRRSNHFGDTSKPLDIAVRDLVERRSGTRPAGPIRLLTNLSYFGYCFNPISLYYCFCADNESLHAIVAEVSNTPWGERHCYVMPIAQGTDDGHAWRFRNGKEMHVSPFMGMDIEYDWLLTVPNENLVVRIHNFRDSESFFNATLILRREEISSKSLASALARFPFMTMQVMFAIHWQAFRLWIKHCPVIPHPNKSKAVKVSQ